MSIARSNSPDVTVFSNRIRSVPVVDPSNSWYGSAHDVGLTTNDSTGEVHSHRHPTLVATRAHALVATRTHALVNRRATRQPGGQGRGTARALHHQVSICVYVCMERPIRFSSLHPSPYPFFLHSVNDQPTAAMTVGRIQELLAVSQVSLVTMPADIFHAVFAGRGAARR